MPGRGHREGQDLRRAQPVRRGHAPRPAAGAVPRHDPRGLAQGGLRLRRGHQGGRLHAAQRQDEAAHPAAAAVQEPRQRGHLGRPRWRATSSARPRRPAPTSSPRPRRRSCIVEDGRVRRRALRRQGPRQGRRAARQLRARAPTSRRRRRCSPRAAGATSPAPRSASSTSPRTASRRSGSSASRRSGRSPSRSTALIHTIGPWPLKIVRQVRADRRHLDLPDEGREDRRRPRLDRLRHRPRVRRRDDLGPRPAAAVQAAPAGQEDPRGRRARRLGRQGAARRRLLVDAEALDARRACSSATPAAWSTRSR